MLNNVELYYFSPTGGTKTCGEIFCKGISEKVHLVDLGLRAPVPAPEAELVVFALPVYSGRIPALTAEKISVLKAEGKKAITMVIYGVRAYEDALLELNDTVTACGFEIVASAAVVARHSIVPAVGQNRPDEDDAKSITEFAGKVLSKLEGNETQAVSVPGNRPYKEVSKTAASPVCLPECIKCGKCVELCPTAAMHMEDDGVKTDTELCILCMACTAACPKAARVLPAPLQAAMDEKLSAFIPVRRENEYFL